MTLPGLANASKTVVDFGYDPSLNFQCSQRAEPCVAVSATCRQVDPYRFSATDSYDGVDCSGPCTIIVPAISGRVLYYRWKYRNLNGVVLAASPTGVSAVP